MNHKLALPLLALATCSFAVNAQGAVEPPSPSARELALEQRIADLERTVRELLAREAAPPPAAAAAAAPAAPTIQTTPINVTAVPGTRFSFGGFIKMEGVATATDGGELPDGGAARLLYLPGAIPVGAADESTDLDASAQFSRFWFASDSTLDDGTALRGYLEFDLFGSALGTETATNTYGATVRHAWASFGPWMAGQTWSNFQDPASLVDSIDLVGATDATIFVRQPQVRYTKGPWSFSLENPETTVGSFRGNWARISSDDNQWPDLTARYTHRGDWGHWSVSGLLRELRHQTTTGIDETATGYGVSVSGRRVLNAANDLRFGVVAGHGIGRYVGFAIAPDVILDGRNQFEVLNLTAGFAGWRHVFNPKLRGNLFGSIARFDNDIAVSGAGATEMVSSIAANLIYTPFPRVDVGLEGRLGQRSLESGAEGDLSRLHFHIRYSF